MDVIPDGTLDFICIFWGVPRCGFEIMLGLYELCWIGLTNGCGVGMILLFTDDRGRDGEWDINAVGDEFNDNCCNLISIISRLQTTQFQYVQFYD